MSKYYIYVAPDGNSRFSFSTLKEAYETYIALVFATLGRVIIEATDEEDPGHTKAISRIELQSRIVAANQPLDELRGLSLEKLSLFIERTEEPKTPAKQETHNF